MVGGRASYLYADGGRYWFGAQPSAARVVSDRSGCLNHQRDELHLEIVRQAEGSATTVADDVGRRALPRVDRRPTLEHNRIDPRCCTRPGDHAARRRPKEARASWQDGPRNGSGSDVWSGRGGPSEDAGRTIGPLGSTKPFPFHAAVVLDPERLYRPFGKVPLR